MTSFAQNGNESCFITASPNSRQCTGALIIWAICFRYTSRMIRQSRHCNELLSHHQISHYKWLKLIPSHTFHGSNRYIDNHHLPDSQLHAAPSSNYITSESRFIRSIHDSVTNFITRRRMASSHTSSMDKEFNIETISVVSSSYSMPNGMSKWMREI